MNGHLANEPARQAWRVREFCEALRIAPSTFWKYHGLGQIKTIKVGRRVLVPSDELARISKEGLQPSKGEAA